MKYKANLEVEIESHEDDNNLCSRHCNFLEYIDGDCKESDFYCNLLLYDNNYYLENFDGKYSEKCYRSKKCLEIFG